MPEVPQAAKANTKEGAIAFVGHYVKLLNHSLVTGDTKSLIAASGADCGSCQNAISRVEEIYGSGGHVRGGEWRIGRVMSAGQRSGQSEWGVSLIVEFDEQTVVSGEPPETDQNKAGTLAINFTVARQPAGWTVMDWTRAS